MSLERLKRLAGLTEGKDAKMTKEVAKCAAEKKKVESEDAEEKKPMSPATNAAVVDESVTGAGSIAAFPTAVDFTTDNTEKTGVDKLKASKIEIPKDVLAQTQQRIKELVASIEEYDGKGYNDHSLKHQTIDAIEQILKNLQSADEEGYQQAQTFYLTLMSPMHDLFPPKLSKFLAHRTNPKSEGEPVEIKTT